MALRYLSPLHRATRQIDECLAPRVGSLGVSNEEAHVTTYIRAYGPCSVGRLRDVFGLKGSTLTGLLDRLEDRGLVRRDRHPTDRRSFLIAITPAGQQTADRVRVVLATFESDLDRHVTHEDLRGFQRVLEAIAIRTQSPREREHQT